MSDTSEVPGRNPAPVPSTGAAPVQDEGGSPLWRLLPHILQTLQREPALVGTLAYVLVALAGIFYSHSFYRKFDIPILGLSQISDFLVAGIQEPVALGLVLSTFLLCWVFDWVGTRYRRHMISRRSRLLQAPSSSLWHRLRLRMINSQITKDWHEQAAYLLVVVLYGWAFVSVFANYRADAVKRGDAAEVKVWLSGEEAGPGQTWTWLGAVSNYVFVYDPASARSQILPVESIVRMEPLKQSKAVEAPAAANP